MVAYGSHSFRSTPTVQVYNDECMCKPGFNSKFSTNPADKFVFTTFEQFTKLVFKWVWGTEK